MTASENLRISQSLTRAHRIVRNNRLLAIGLVLMFATILPIVFAPVVSPYDPGEMDLQNANHPPSIDHPMGTDNFGRDVFARVLYGGRVSLMISVSGVLMAFTIGASMGVTAGYFGGRLDELLMRIIDALMVFPSFVLALMLAPALGGGLVSVVVAIGLVFSPNFARISRGSTLTVKEEAFIDAAKCLGFSDRRIMRSDIFPNILTPVMVQGTILAGYAIIVEAGLSFLGLGVAKDDASLGLILAAGREFITNAPWIIVMTGLYMTVMILSFNLIGDGLRDTLDPSLEQEVGEAKE
ncbi:ABC transporter permease [Haloarchaeobius sp. TZWWS8]|uniref:ABC transporter permease n=1 Tax=Haloarchaeobius sp. TZWWS8 TaxID=3446121 RepID=UPI003EBC8699